MATATAMAMAMATSAGIGTANGTGTATVVTTSNEENSGGGGGGGGGGIESAFRAVYNGYKQCEGEADTLSCLKLKALKLVDRALSINNIPITEAISLAKREDNQRSLNEQWTAAAEAAATHNAIDDQGVAASSHSAERDNAKLNDLLWKRLKQFVESRSLQLRVNKLLFGDGDGDGDSDYDYDYDENANANVNANDDVARQSAAKLRDENVNATDEDDGGGVRKTSSAAAAARGKKDKNKGMYMYMMMMKGGMMALAYKGLALLAGKALLVSKIALTLALLVAIKKLFSGGHHSQKTTYEIVKTPIITHSHQYGSGGGAGAGNPQSGHYATDFTGYEGGPYARSLDEPLLQQQQQQQQQQQRQRITLKAIDMTDADSRYTTTRTAASAQARSLAHRQVANDDGDADSHHHHHEQHIDSRVGVGQVNIPYAHLAAYRKQLMENTTPTPTPTTIPTMSLKSDATSLSSP